MAADYPVRPITVAEFPAFHAVAEHAFNSAAPSEPSRQHEFATFEADRSLAAFDQASMVATASAYSFTMAVPGALAEVAGVTAVAVLPSHRRRGILSGLMRRQLADLRDSGEAVAALFASESGIYGRYGYGAASAQLRFTLRRGEAQLTRPQDAWPGAPAAQGVRLRIADAHQPRAELAAVFDAILPTRPGMHARDDRWWDSLLADPEHNRRGASPLRCVLAEDDTGPRGYALYNVQPEWGDDGIPAGVLNVRELLADGPEAFAVLWGDLLTRDLVGEVRARQRPVDDPLLHLLADRRRARAQLTDGLWVRLVDVQRAPFAAPLRLPGGSRDRRDRRPPHQQCRALAAASGRASQPGVLRADHGARRCGPACPGAGCHLPGLDQAGRARRFGSGCRAPRRGAGRALYGPGVGSGALVPDDLLTSCGDNGPGRTAMAGMKVTVDAAMRARDVSRPHAEHEVLAQSLDSEAAGPDRRGQPDRSQAGRPGQPDRSQAARPGQPDRSQAGRRGQPDQSQTARPGQPNQSQTARPGQPNQSQTARPGQPAPAQPAAAPSGAAQPAPAQPAAAPGAAQPAPAQPAAGQPATGQPATGQAAGPAASGQAAAGPPRAAQPAPAQRAAAAGGAAGKRARRRRRR